MEFQNGLTLVSDKITEADGEYVCNFKVDKYTKGGNYKLEFLILQDGSIHKNKSTYLYSDSIIPDKPAFFPMGSGNYGRSGLCPE